MISQFTKTQSSDLGWYSSAAELKDASPVASANLAQALRKKLNAFRASDHGNVAMIVSLAAIPIVDFCGRCRRLLSRKRAENGRPGGASVPALLAGARTAPRIGQLSRSMRSHSHLASTKCYVSAAVFQPTEQTDGTKYIGSATASITTSLLGIMGVNTLTVTAYGTATAAEARQFVHPYPRQRAIEVSRLLVVKRRAGGQSFSLLDPV